MWSLDKIAFIAAVYWRKTIKLLYYKHLNAPYSHDKFGAYQCFNGLDIHAKAKWDFSLYKLTERIFSCQTNHTWCTEWLKTYCKQTSEYIAHYGCVHMYAVSILPAMLSKTKKVQIIDKIISKVILWRFAKICSCYHFPLSDTWSQNLRM